MSSPFVFKNIIIRKVPYDQEAVALFNRMTTQPNSKRKQLISNFFKGLKSDLNISSLSQGFDCLWFFAAHTQQAAQQNWVKNAHNITEVNAPSWATDLGYTSNGSTSYLNSNYNANTQGITYTKNNAHVLIYARQNIAEGNLDCGAVDAGSVATSLIATRTAGDLLNARINTSVVYASTSLNSQGLAGVDRSASNAQQHYKNGNTIGVTDTTETSTMISLDVFILCRNNNGSPQLYSTKQISFMCIGKSVGSAGQLAIFRRVETFLDAIGAGVI